MTVRDLAINGYDLINLGFEGPEIGKSLNALLELVLDNPERNTREELLALANKKHYKYNDYELTTLK